MKLAWLLLAWSVGCFAQAPTQVPKVFVTTIQPSLKPQHALQFDGTALVYTIRFGAQVETQKITPTPAQWAAFRHALDELKVWRWRASYTESRVPDSTTWSLKVEYADRSVASAGTAAFPDRSTDRTLPRYAFNRYQLAVQELIGRPFGRGVKSIEVFDVRELHLVGTHASKDEAEEWADFRDPKGKVHRVALHEPVGARGTLQKVHRSSVTVSVMSRDAKGEWKPQEKTLPLTPAKK
ncbi:MAG TPA: pilus assembly protein PilP [Burkholderiales bacterium]|nr:pilus assembly protein PilP [Burkholderiales bacterium]